MQAFSTPNPVAVTMSIGNGRVRLVASDRADTVVTVAPGGSGAAEAAVAEDTRVEYAAGELTITSPKPQGLGGVLGKGHPLRVTVELPVGSVVDINAVHADIRSERVLGECRFRTSSGMIELAEVGSLVAETSSSTIAVGHVAGHAEIRGSTAKVKIGKCDGPLKLRNAIGDVVIDEAAADVDVRTSSGRISVGRAAANVTVKNSNGRISVGEAIRGKTYLTTALGSLEIGIAEGSAALVDARSTLGSVRNALTPQDDPGSFAEKVMVVGRTWSGNITVQRATYVVPSGQ
jgi:hypothetical protein